MPNLKKILRNNSEEIRINCIVRLMRRKGEEPMSDLVGYEKQIYEQTQREISEAKKNSFKKGLEARPDCVGGMLVEASEALELACGHLDEIIREHDKLGKQGIVRVNNIRPKIERARQFIQKRGF